MNGVNGDWSARLRAVAQRPSDVWREDLAEETAELAAGILDPDDADLAELFPESLLTGTDQALAAFEQEVQALAPSSDSDVLQAVQLVMLALNAVNNDHDGAAYETDEREMLCAYIDETLVEAGVDVRALELRQGLKPQTIGDKWRDW